MLWSYVQHKPHRPLFVDGKLVEPRSDLKRQIDSVSMELRSQIGRLWCSSEQGEIAAEAARVLYVGGDACYFAPLLRTNLPALMAPKQPESANVQGYLAVGQRLSERVWARLHP